MTKEELIEQVKKNRLSELEYRMSYWDEEDQKLSELTDIEYVINEAEYLIEDITEDTGHLLHDDWKQAKSIIRLTKNGTRKRILFPSMDVAEGWRDEDVEWARSFLDEVKRTKKFIAMLKKMQKGE